MKSAVRDVSLVWLRRDLRLEDNAALSKACAESTKVAVAFVFDSNILGQLKSKLDARVTFIYDSIVELNDQLKKQGSQLIVVYGDPLIEVPKIAKKIGAGAVYFNEDYEPSAKVRDKKVRSALESANLQCHALKDQVIFSGQDISKSDGSPYKMFTPYKNVWLKKLKSSDYLALTVAENRFMTKKVISEISQMPSLKQVGFLRSESLLESPKPGRSAALKALKRWAEGLESYHLTRDFPRLGSGTSGLSVHLRFGTISIRECVRLCMGHRSAGSTIWLSELIWREFYHMILDRFPHVAKGAFKKDYEKIKWQGTDENFNAWCEGRTGFPIVDAGLRQLNQTGWMHNRLRMITASFLVKDLLVDWRKGEAYFAEKLLDFDLAANNGGWQWCASTGCDSQPYFRIFNPVRQSQKFDADCEFIKEWVPELKALSAKEIHFLSLDAPSQANPKFTVGIDYPNPIVEHSRQTVRALTMYRELLK